MIFHFLFSLYFKIILKCYFNRKRKLLKLIQLFKDHFLYIITFVTCNMSILNSSACIVSVFTRFTSFVYGHDLRLYLEHPRSEQKIMLLI